MVFFDSFQNQLIKPPGFATHTSLHFLASAKAWIHGKMQETEETWKQLLKQNVSKKKKTKNLDVFFFVTFLENRIENIETEPEIPCWNHN